MIKICSSPKRFVAALGRGRRCTRDPMLHRAFALSSLSNKKSLSTMPSVNLPSHKISALSFSSVVAEEPQTTPLPLLVLEGDRNQSWWTGKPPAQCVGYNRDGRLHSVPQITFHQGLTKDKIQRYFDNTWTLTEVLLGCLQGEAAFVTPPYHELRHPLIFYYGHPAALYINKLRVAGLLKEPINPYYEVIFETGVDEMSWDDLSKNKMYWPSVAEVHAYRKEVYQAVSSVISNISDAELAAATLDMKASPLWALFMAFEHERIHLETSSVLISELPVQLTRFPPGFPAYHASIYENDRRRDVRRIPQAGVDYPVNDMIYCPKQTITLGKPHSYPTYGWDNEYGSRSYDIPAFKGAKFKTTNGEFFDFVADGGYSDSNYWTEAGWRWRVFRNTKWPSFWVRDGPQGLNHFKLRLLFDEVSMKWDLPVTVNYHEAAAFAAWKSKRTGRHLRVMTELEHHAIRGSAQQVADVSKTVDTVAQPDATGEHLLSEMGVNVNLGCASMSPVTALPPNEKGFHDVFGNCWDWTCDYFSALKGFEVHSYYEDFSTPCFDGLHHVIVGGSFISTGNEASVFSRFHFRPHFFQHASFRLAELADPQTAPLVTSDTDAPGPYVGTYPFRRSSNSGAMSAEDEAAARADKESAAMSKHFGAVPPSFGIPPSLRSFTSTVEDLVKASAVAANVDLATANVLEVGCGRGGAVFALAKSARFVMGISHHQRDIDIALELAVQKSGSYTLRGEGGRKEVSKVVLPAHITVEEWANVSRGSVEFRCADPMCLPAELSGFDICVLSDVLDKVASPGAVLSRLGGMRGMVRSGGLLVILSTFDWNENCTPKSLWLGSEHEHPEAALKRRLADDFEHLETREVPLFWLETCRDLRGKLYHVTTWKRLAVHENKQL